MANEKRLIFVEKAVKDLENEIYWNESTKAAIRAFLRTLPAADAVEVVHGHWERFKQPSGTHAIRCSRCKTRDGMKAPFCRFCGAKMDGGNEDG